MSVTISGTGAITGVSTNYSFDKNVSVGPAVGVGTTALDVNGSIRIKTAAAGTRGLYIGDGTTNGRGIIVSDHDRQDADVNLLALQGRWANNQVASIFFQTGSDTVNKEEGYIEFKTRKGESGGMPTRMTLSSEGNLGIGSTNPSTRLTIDNTTPIDTTQTAIAGELGNIYLEMSSGGTQGAGNLGPSINFTGINQSGIDGRKAAIIAQQTGSNSSQVGLSFWTNNTNDSSGVIQERMVINANGNVGINTDSAAVELSIGGTIRVQNSADATQYLSIDYQGLNFQNTGAGSSSTAAAHLLDDYEEGTWTPTFTNGTWTYGKQHGRYTKIGNTVHITSIITWTNRSGTGDLQIDLPFLTLGTVTQDRYVGSIGYLSGVDLDSPEKQLINTVSGDRTGLGFFVVVDNAGSVTTKVQNTSTVGEVQSSITIMVS